MTNKTNLPPVEEVKSQQITMKIELVDVSSYPSQKCTTKFGIVDRWHDENSRQLVANVYKIDEPRTLGFIPTKIWCDHVNHFWTLLYYINGTLPIAVRPFGDQPCYLFTYAPKISETIEYDPTALVFIDQSMHPEDGMTYIVIFGEDQLKNVLTTQWDGTPWADAVKLY
jgi:hypothetical protein